MQKMKIAYLTPAEPSDKQAWSGLSHYMRHSLERAGMEVETLGKLRFPAALWPSRAWRACAFRTGLARQRMWQFEPAVVRSYVRQIERLLDRSKADIIFSSGTIQVAELKTSRPVVFWTDATFSRLLDYYFARDGIAPVSLRQGDATERAAIHKAHLGFYASSWAAESALADYGADPKRIHVVPFGANLQVEPTDEEVARWIEERSLSPCRFLFLGVDGSRKGGDLALELVASLEREGMRCELTLAGCQPPPGMVLPPNVTSLGFIDKTTPEGRATMRSLLAQSHFLLVPSRAECFGLVFAEASAFGVPSLTTTTGGIPSAVRDGLNGFGVPLGPGLIAGLAAHVRAIMSDRDRYRALAHSSRQEYVGRLNWETSGLRIRKLLEQL
jgi:glycosyltransferase involved in cell wall biosynthesis